jgi:hypothetical protein
VRGTLVPLHKNHVGGRLWRVWRFYPAVTGLAALRRSNKLEKPKLDGTNVRASGVNRTFS